MDPRRIGSAENKVSAKTDVQMKIRKNEMLIIKSEYIGTYTMAKLTEALRGENSMSESSQQLPTTKHTDA